MLCLSVHSKLKTTEQCLPYLGMLMFAVCPSRVLVLQRLFHLLIEYHQALQSACDIHVRWLSFPRSQQLLWNRLLFSLSNTWTTAFCQLLRFSWWFWLPLFNCVWKYTIPFLPALEVIHPFGFSLIIHSMASPFHLQKALPCFSGLDCWCSWQLCSSQPRSFFSQLPLRQCLLNFVSSSFLLSFLD